MTSIPANTNLPRDSRALDNVEDFVTVLVAGQLFGLPIGRVHEVFIASTLTDVPLAPREIVGLLNLRGRIVTAMCLRRRLGLPDVETQRGMAVGLELGGESYGLLIDDVGEVMRLSCDSMEAVPVHLDAHWSRLARGVFRVDRQLLIILDVDAVLALDDMPKAA
jgi:purine-binding chemotaxis protein CheW